MKTRWLMTACATAVFAFTSMAAAAPKQKDQNRGQTQRTENRGQTKKRYRQFNANQRQYATTYYNQNRNQEIFRPDRRWNDDYQNRLQPGYVLDNDMRGMSRPAPIEMHRYVVIGGNVVLIDNGYRVHDAIRFSINIGL
ncbi:MAG: hypothetical protein ABSA70_12975 [Terriglobia bacterium]